VADRADGGRLARARPGGRRAPLNGWLADIVVGVLVGSLIVGGLGQSVLVTARVGGSTLVAVILIATGSILGVAFMRLVRTRAEAPDDAPDPGPPPYET
jgi:hypothetical protein